MSKNRISATPGRRLCLFGVLMFTAGLVVGLASGVLSARYILFHFRPSPLSISKKRANQLQKDFSLSDEVRDKIFQENQRLFSEMSEDILARHYHMEKMLAAHVDNIALLLPDDAARNKWRATFRGYFPPPPPPPPNFSSETSQETRSPRE